MLNLVLSWMGVFAIASVALVTSVACVIVYRLWFHPLSQIPGPMLQRISGLPKIWQCYKGNRHICEAEAHEKYGNVIRIGPNSITFNTLSSLQTIHAKSANVFKGDEFYGLLDGGPEGGQSIQMTQENTEHASRRKILDHSMPSRDQVFKDIDRISKRLVEVVYSVTQENNGKVDMTIVTTWYSFDVISTLAFGNSMEMLDSHKYRWLPRCLQDTSVFLYAAGYASGHTPGLRFWRWLLGSSWPCRLAIGSAKAAQRYADFASEQVSKRKDRMREGKHDETGQHDIFGGLIQTGLYTDLELRADSSLLIAAGSDAVRLTIVATLFYWMKNPKVMRKAVEEVRSHTSTHPDGVNEITVASSKYLRACIDETMRLTPPKASSVPREVKAGGVISDGICVPQGMTVGISTYSLHHDPTIFPQPWEYKPERWLQRPIDPRMHGAFHPFLKGPRACPGKMVAYFAIQLALFHLVSNFDFVGMDDSGSGSNYTSKFSTEKGNEYPFFDWIIGFGKGPVLTLRRRYSN